MLHEAKWVAGALAAALWVAPAAAQTSSTGSSSGTGSATSSDSAKSTTNDAPSGTTAGSTTSSDTKGSTTSPDTSASNEPSSTRKASPETKRTLGKLHAANQMEVKAGEWMKEHATNDKVKDFASKMVDDHGKMDADVESLAKDESIDLTSSTKGEHDAKLDRLQKMHGAQADREYMRMMVEDHQKDLKEVRAAHAKAKKANDTKLTSLLDDAQSKISDHLNDARTVQKSLSQRQARTPSGSAGDTSSSGSMGGTGTSGSAGSMGSGTTQGSDTTGSAPSSGTSNQSGSGNTGAGHSGTQNSGSNAPENTSPSTSGSGSGSNPSK